MPVGLCPVEGFAYFNCLLSSSQLLSLFLSKMCYKVAPPSGRNVLNISPLSIVPESEIGTNAPTDLGRSLTDFPAIFSVWN